MDLYPILAAIHDHRGIDGASSLASFLHHVGFIVAFVATLIAGLCRK